MCIPAFPFDWIIGEQLLVATAVGVGRFCRGSGAVSLVRQTFLHTTRSWNEWWKAERVDTTYASTAPQHGIDDED